MTDPEKKQITIVKIFPKNIYFLLTKIKNYLTLN